MHKRLTTSWSLTLLGFIALACTPLPFVFYSLSLSLPFFSLAFPSAEASFSSLSSSEFGPRIRSYSKHVPQAPVPLPSTSTIVQDGSTQQSPIFLHAGEEGVRVEKMQDGIEVDDEIDVEKQ